MGMAKLANRFVDHRLMLSEPEVFLFLMEVIDLFVLKLIEDCDIIF